MDIEAFSKYYVDAVSLSADDNNAALPHIYKQMSMLKIGPDETDFKNSTRKVLNFNNKNLDIITDPANSYLYCLVTLKVIVNGTDIVSLNDNTAAVLRKSATSTTDDQGHFNPVGIPSTANWIDGFDYKWNDTTLDNENNSLPATLYAHNLGKYTTYHEQQKQYGLVQYESPVYLQGEKEDKQIEWIIRLSDIIPFLLDNKQVVNGIKQTLTITKNVTMNEIFKWVGGAIDTNYAVKDLEFEKIEWHLPYYKLENTKQLELWNNMYASTFERYWLGNDKFISSPIENDTPKSNEIWRISTKGLNARPRWLLLHAVTADVATFSNDTFYPIGAHKSDDNQLRVSKLRLKINGIHLDQGTVWEGGNKSIATANGLTCHNGFIPQYENYTKFFNYHNNSKELCPMSFEKWMQQQIFVFDLVNGIDSEQIFANSGNALIIELEYSTYAGSSTTKKFKWVANLLHDKRIRITQSENKAVLEQF